MQKQLAMTKNHTNICLAWVATMTDQVSYRLSLPHCWIPLSVNMSRLPTDQLTVSVPVTCVQKMYNMQQCAWWIAYEGKYSTCARAVAVVHFYTSQADHRMQMEAEFLLSIMTDKLVVQGSMKFFCYTGYCTSTSLCQLKSQCVYIHRDLYTSKKNTEWDK